MNSIIFSMDDPLKTITLPTLHLRNTQPCQSGDIKYNSHLRKKQKREVSEKEDEIISDLWREGQLISNQEHPETCNLLSGGGDAISRRQNSKQPYGLRGTKTASTKDSKPAFKGRRLSTDQNGFCLDLSFKSVEKPAVIKSETEKPNKEGNAPKAAKEILMVSHIFDKTKFCCRPSPLWDIRPGVSQENTRNRKRKGYLNGSATGGLLYTQAVLAGLTRKPSRETTFRQEMEKLITLLKGSDKSEEDPKLFETPKTVNTAPTNNATLPPFERGISVDSSTSTIATVGHSSEISSDNESSHKCGKHISLENNMYDSVPKTMSIDNICSRLTPEDFSEILKTMMAPDIFTKETGPKNSVDERKKSFNMLVKAILLSCNYNMPISFAVTELPQETAEPQHDVNTKSTKVRATMSVEQVRSLKSKPTNNVWSSQFLNAQRALGAHTTISNKIEPEPRRTLRHRRDRSAQLAETYNLEDHDSSGEDIKKQKDDTELLGNGTTEKSWRDVMSHKKRISTQNNADIESYNKRAGRPKVNRAGCKCLLCGTFQTPQWRFMIVFDDNWMDLVCNACYMKFNGCRPYYSRSNRAPPSIPQLQNIVRPERPSLADYRQHGPCAYPHLMRRADSKQFSILRKESLENGESGNESTINIEPIVTKSVDPQNEKTTVERTSGEMTIKTRSKREKPCALNVNVKRRCSTEAKHQLNSYLDIAVASLLNDSSVVPTTDLTLTSSHIPDTLLNDSLINNTTIAADETKMARCEGRISQSTPPVAESSCTSEEEKKNRNFIMQTIHLSLKKEMSKPTMIPAAVQIGAPVDTRSN